MAEAYGNQVQKWRCYVKAWITSQNDTSATIKCETYFQSLKWGYDTRANAVATVHGQSSGSQTFTASSGTGQSVTTLVASKTVTVSKGANGYNVWCSGTVNLTGGYHNGSSSAGVNVWVPQRAYYKPKPPKGFAAQRIDDAQMKLTWQGDYTGMDGGYPWSNVYIDRSTDGGGWQQIATLGWDATNYTDRSTEANHTYQYGARAKGAGGTSDRVSAAALHTTPAAPASVSLSKTAGTMVRVEANVSGVRTATSYEVESNLNDGGWSGSQTVASFPVTIDVGGGKASVRVRSVRGDLKSAWTESDEITTITPPLAPALSGLPAVAPTGSEQALIWAPNHPDASAQSSAEVEYTVGDAVKTVEIKGDATTWAIPPEVMAVASTISVRVRTKGLHADWGAWSAPVSMRIAVPPRVSITSPGMEGGIIDRLPMQVAWTVEDSTGVASQLLELVDAGGVTVYSARTTERAHSIGAAQYMMADHSDYTLRLTVTGGSSLATTATRSIATEYAAPSTPQASYDVGEGLAVRIVASDGNEPDKPATVSISVVRLMPDGAQWMVADGLRSGEGCIDPLPPLNLGYEYLVTAYSEIGTAATLHLPAQVETGLVAFNFGPSAGTVETMRYDPSWSRQVSRKVKLYDFADGGAAGGLPMAYTSTTVESGGKQAFTLLDLDQMRRIDALGARYAVCWYRDLYGGRRRCAVAWDLSADVPYSIVKASADLTDVRFQEAW